jgi:hypothetical protein
MTETRVLKEKYKYQWFSWRALENRSQHCLSLLTVCFHFVVVWENSDYIWRGVKFKSGKRNLHTVSSWFFSWVIVFSVSSFVSFSLLPWRYVLKWICPQNFPSSHLNILSPLQQQAPLHTDGNAHRLGPIVMNNSPGLSFLTLDNLADTFWNLKLPY